MFSKALACGISYPIVPVPPHTAPITFYSHTQNTCHKFWNMSTLLSLYGKQIGTWTIAWNG